MPQHTRNSSQLGQGLVEYTLIGALVVVAALVSLRTLGGTLNTQFGALSSSLNVTTAAAIGGGQQGIKH